MILMSNFKDFLANDLQNTFFNKNEFAEEVNVDGRTITVIMDPELLTEKQLKSGGEGLEKAELLFYASKSEFEYKPEISDRMDIDDRIYYVLTVSDEKDMYVITLERFQS